MQRPKSTRPYGADWCHEDESFAGLEELNCAAGEKRAGSWGRFLEGPDEPMLVSSAIPVFDEADEDEAPIRLA